MKVVPLGDKLVVKRLESNQKTAGGIVLPDAARQKPQQGRVLSVGDGRMLPDGSRVAHEVTEGDRVVFGSYAGSEVSIDDEKLLILSADDVLAIVHQAPSFSPRGVAVIDILGSERIWPQALCSCGG